VLERPRLVCMRDGRIFLEESLRDDGNYLKNIYSILKYADETFRDKELNRAWPKLKNSFH